LPEKPVWDRTDGQLDPPSPRVSVEVRRDDAVHITLFSISRDVVTARNGAVDEGDANDSGW